MRSLANRQGHDCRERTLARLQDEVRQPLSNLSIPVRFIAGARICCENPRAILSRWPAGSEPGSLQVWPALLHRSK